MIFFNQILIPSAHTNSYHINCKPFYVAPASEREMEACVCIKCLNPHTIYDALRKHLVGLPYSLTEYLTDSFKCPQDTDIGYPKIDCIKGICRRRCIITNKLNKPKHINIDRTISSDDINTNNGNWNKIIKYYVFEKVSDFYFD